MCGRGDSRTVSGVSAVVLQERNAAVTTGRHGVDGVLTDAYSHSAAACVSDAVTWCLTFDPRAFSYMNADIAALLSHTDCV